MLHSQLPTRACPAGIVRILGASRLSSMGRWLGTSLGVEAKACTQSLSLEMLSDGHIDQCVLGAAVRKPTGILLLRLSSVREMIQRRGNNGFCNHGCKAHVRLQGQDKNGNFRTSVAKVYPPQLNATIAAGVCQFATELMQNSVTEYSINGIPECFKGFRTAEFVSPDCVQKDFHG